ncbi:MAG: site-2 protease family protein [Nitrospirae bacterium]|nr:site-2 protease family protein [Nitrospirota bacterium]
MKRIPYLHVLLFLLTFLTTTLAGALQKGVNPLKEPWRISEGIPFSFTLMAILLSHELSHYFAGRMHRIKATLPYFIPFPFSPIGTFGAFIKMRSPIETRQALIDIGASGPVVGFVVSVVASIIGLHSSEVIMRPMDVTLSLGDSMLFKALSNAVVGVPAEGYEILLHPVAFAGWIGLFVTSLNLIPIGQLDGGHIAFAFLGRFHRHLSVSLVLVLAVLGFFSWEGWSIWAVLMVILGLRHPAVMHWEQRLDPKRRFLGWLSLFIFVVTFIPSPFKVTM